MRFYGRLPAAAGLKITQISLQGNGTNRHGKRITPTEIFVETHCNYFNAANSCLKDIDKRSWQKLELKLVPANNEEL